jgi:hypothetical protein
VAKAKASPPEDTLEELLGRVSNAREELVAVERSLGGETRGQTGRTPIFSAGCPIFPFALFAKGGEEGMVRPERFELPTFWFVGVKGKIQMPYRPLLRGGRILKSTLIGLRWATAPL